MAKREGSSASGPRTRSKAAEERREAEEVESIQRLDKLPQEVWEKILDHLESDDLFPLALSCRYFRQKQKELVERKRREQSGWPTWKPRLAFKTALTRWPRKSQQASADYLRFCSKEKVSNDIPNRIVGVEREKAFCIRILAAHHGHLPLLQELLEPANELETYFTAAAARGGRLETLQWLKTQKGFYLDASLFADACEAGHLEMLKWLRSEGCPWNERACWSAATWGHFEVLKWLRSEGCPWDPGACEGAARRGDLKMLKWLRREGCPWSGTACWGAAIGGHLEILKGLRSEGCPWNARACTGAAEGGHFEILKWLRSEGCPWDACACSSAAERGDFKMLKWLRSQDPPCPWNYLVCSGELRGGHLDVLKWAIDNGCPYEVTAWTRPALESLGIDLRACPPSL